MQRNRKVVLYIAQSLDGYIATGNNDISWLSIVEQDEEDYGYGAFIQSVDTVIMGRKTYEKVLSFGIDFPHKDKTCYVLSKTKSGSDENVTFYNGSIPDLVKDLKDKDGADIFIDGGSEVVREFLNNNLIEEYIISIIPILLGKGIPLFRETETANQLTLLDCKTFASGLVQLKYARKNNT